MSVEQKIKDVIIDELGVEESEITREASFINDLGADSLAAAELVLKLEEEFDIEIEQEEADKITTVGAAIDLVTSKVS